MNFKHGLLLVIVCIIIIIVQEIIKRKEHKEKINNRKNELESKKFNSAIFNYYNQIYIKHETKEWTYNLCSSIYKFEDIIACEILENGITTVQTQTDNKVSLGKAVVGGTLFGPVGAIIGGSAGKSISNSTQTDYCTSLNIKITLNDLSNPCVFLDILNDKNANIEKSSFSYKQASKEAQEILSIFQIMINNK